MDIEAKKDVDVVAVAEKQRHLKLLESVRGGQALSPGELEELRKFEENSGNTHDASRNTHTGLIRDQKKAAKYAGVSDRTIRRWVKEKMPVTAEGWYIKHYLDIWKQNEGKAPTEEKNRQQKAEAEYKELKTKLLQFEYDIKNGKLITIEEVAKLWKEIITTAQKNIRRIPIILKAEMAGVIPIEMADKLALSLEKQIDKILTILAGDQKPDKNS
mgnify:CR=1 FL=1